MSNSLYVPFQFWLNTRENLPLINLQYQEVVINIPNEWWKIRNYNNIIIYNKNDSPNNILDIFDDYMYMLLTSNN